VRSWAKESPGFGDESMARRPVFIRTDMLRVALRDRHVIQERYLRGWLR
jgi:hypothetical protein